MVPEAMAFTTQWVRDNVVAQVGGALDQFQVPRAEDVECVPGRPRDVLFALTSAQGWKAGPTRYGVVRHLREASESPDSATFTWTNVVQGGEADSGLASPDNLAFSGRDHLWVSSDISTSSLNVPGRGFEWHRNNALFYVPLRGSDAGIAYRFANAPVAAEFTGPTFVDERKTLFLSVQHPGENTPLDAPIATDAYTSWWPGGNRTTGTGTPGKPRPSVVTIRPER